MTGSQKHTKNTKPQFQYDWMSRVLSTCQLHENIFRKLHGNMRIRIRMTGLPNLIPGQNLKMFLVQNSWIYQIYWDTLGCPPPSNSGNEGLQGFPTKNVIMLVVTVTGRGDNLRYIKYIGTPPTPRMCQMKV